MEQQSAEDCCCLPATTSTILPTSSFCFPSVAPLLTSQILYIMNCLYKTILTEVAVAGTTHALRCLCYMLDGLLRWRQTSGRLWVCIVCIYVIVTAILSSLRCKCCEFPPENPHIYFIILTSRNFHISVLLFRGNKGEWSALKYTDEIIRNI